MVTPPWWIAWVGYALQAGVAVLAFLHARKVSFHWPVARYTIWVAAMDFARYFLEISRPHRWPLFTVDELTFLSLPAALCYTVIRITERSGATRRPVARTFLWVTLAVAIAITIGYPYSAALWVYSAMQSMCLGLAWFFLGRAFCLGRCWMGITELTLLAYLASETVVLVGDYFLRWPGVWSMMLGLNIGLLAIHAGWEASTRIKRRQEIS